MEAAWRAFDLPAHLQWDAENNAAGPRSQFRTTVRGWPLPALCGTLLVLADVATGWAELYDLADKRGCPVLHRWRAHSGIITCCTASVHRASPLLVTTSSDCVRVWDLTLLDEDECASERTVPLAKSHLLRYEWPRTPGSSPQLLAIEIDAASAFGDRLAVVSQRSIDIYDLTPSTAGRICTIHRQHWRPVAVSLRGPRDLFCFARRGPVECMRLALSGNGVTDTLVIAPRPHEDNRCFARCVATSAPNMAVCSTAGVMVSRHLRPAQTVCNRADAIEQPDVDSPLHCFQEDTQFVMRGNQLVICIGDELDAYLVPPFDSHTAVQRSWPFATSDRRREDQPVMRTMTASWRHLVAVTDEGFLIIYDFAKKGDVAVRQERTF